MAITCPMCGAPMNTDTCEYCGWKVRPEPNASAQYEQTSYGQQTTNGQQNINFNYTQPQQERSPYSRFVALLLCLFLGTIGVHRFYVGKIGTGLLYLFTGGCFGIGFIIDLITILCGVFTDSRGRALR